MTDEELIQELRRDVAQYDSNIRTSATDVAGHNADLNSDFDRAKFAGRAPCAT